MGTKKIYLVGFWSLSKQTFFTTLKWSFVDKFEADKLVTHWQRRDPDLGICVEDMDGLRANDTKIREWDYY